jgi:hypothetical protein
VGADAMYAVEVKLHGGNAWWNFALINATRDYAMFSLLAGIRSGEDRDEPLFPLRGLPADSEFDYDTENGYTVAQGWLTLEELNRVVQAYREGPDERRWASAEVPAVIAMMAALDGAMETRFVFGFDQG